MAMLHSLDRRIPSTKFVYDDIYLPLVFVDERTCESAILPVSLQGTRRRSDDIIDDFEISAAEK
jgi:hypothetical protein